MQQNERGESGRISLSLRYRQKNVETFASREFLNISKDELDPKSLIYLPLENLGGL